MKIIHKYVLREHAGPLFFATSALTSLLLLNYIAKRLGDLVGKGLPWSVIGEFFLLSMPFTVAMTLPMAVLVSSLYAFSRLAAENEVTALKANGVSLARLTVPVFVAACALSAFMVFFNDQVLPRANHRLRTLQGDIARKKPTFAMREQVINEVSPGRFFLKAGHLDEFSNRMKEVTIYDLSDPLRRRSIYADSGMMAFSPNATDLYLTLHQGYTLEVPKDKPLQLQRLDFATDFVRVKDVSNQLDITREDSYKSDREMSVCELQNEVSRNEFSGARARESLRHALVSAVREATTGTPATAAPDTGLPTVDFPGAPAPRSLHWSVGRIYCDAIAASKRTILGARKKGVALLGVRSAYAGTLGGAQDTTRTKKDSATKDTARVKVDTAKPVLPPPTEANINPQLPTPVLPIAPSTGVVPPPAALPGQPLISTDSATVAAVLAPSYPTFVSTQPFIISGAIDGARARMGEARGVQYANAVELHKKFAISVACAVFVLIGAPIALRFPRGGVGLVIGVSLIVFAIYYIGLIGGESLADRGFVTPAIAMWSANVIFTIVGVWLLVRLGGEGATARGGDLGDLMESVKASFSVRRARGRRSP